MIGQQANSFHVIGADVGGTHIKGGIVDARGHLKTKETLKTDAKGGSEKILAALRELIVALQGIAGKEGITIVGVGIGVTGQVDFRSGAIVGGIAGKIPGWIGTPVKDLIQKEVGLPVVVDNDGNVSALAEHRVGAGLGTSSMASITIGTGIGGGLILDGKLFRGSAGVASELGHWCIDIDGPLCDCGIRGCLEAYVSGSAMIRMVLKRLSKGQETSILRLANNRHDEINPEIVGLAAREGDKLAIAVIEEISRTLGVGLANIVNVLCPEVIVIGGGVAQLGELLFERVRIYTAEWVFGVAINALRILPSKLGPHAGVIGAALLAFEHLASSHHHEGGE